MSGGSTAWLSSGTYVWLDAPTHAWERMEAWGEARDAQPGIFLLGGDGSRGICAACLGGIGRALLDRE